MIQVFWGMTLCHLVSCSLCFKRSFKVLGRTCPTTQCHLSEDLIIQQHHCENLKSHSWSVSVSQNCLSSLLSWLPCMTWHRPYSFPGTSNQQQICRVLSSNGLAVEVQWESLRLYRYVLLFDISHHYFTWTTSCDGTQHSAIHLCRYSVSMHCSQTYCS